MQILLDIEDSINLDEFIFSIKELYPDKRIISVLPKSSKELKKFGGISDLKTLQVENFIMYPREELYDR